MSASLVQELDPEAILLGVEANDREEVIRLLAGRLERLGYVKPSFAEAVVERERKLPTGLPLGRQVNVAVPHTDPVHVLKPGVALATLAAPVDFANMEDAGEAVPVGVVFMLALNHKDRQIEMLQAVMAAIQAPETVERLIAAGSVAEICGLLGTRSGTRSETMGESQ